MGIRGLTTFIDNRSHLYLEDYQLHNCKVVIDGNSIACQLYKWHCRSNDCFGGDYDKYAHTVHSFFEVLFQCNVTPYVILDGGYESRKLATVISRMKNKIRAAGQLNSVTEGSVSVFPLFIRETFLDVVLSLGIKTARCEFEGDTETASIAKALDCPVLSYDSDYYIFNALYIPFSTFDFIIRVGRNKDTKQCYRYISCKIYRIEKFLKFFGGLDEHKLPVLAVLLGNDYVKRSVFSKFFDNLKVHKCKGNQSDQQHRIKSVILWLQNETNNSAIRKVLSRYKKQKRRLILWKIKSAIKGYYFVNTALLKYLDITPVAIINSKEDVDIQEIEDTVEEEPEVEDEIADGEDSEDTESETTSSEENILGINEDLPLKRNLNVPEVFLINFRKCVYPACFMDIILRNKYYCVPQVEGDSFEHSHVISLDIVSAIHKILTCGSGKTLIYCAKNIHGMVQKFQLAPFSKKVPSLIDIQEMDEDTRKRILFTILHIDHTFFDILSWLPPSWHLFLISIKYIADKCNFELSIVFSLILNYIILNYIDQKVGFHRVTKTFEKKFASRISDIKKANSCLDVSSNDFGLHDLSYEESLLCLHKVLSYFQMDIKMKTNYKLYDKELVHKMAQIQSCFLHIRYLNNVLNNPYPIFFIHRVFDGTFMYNMTKNLRKRSDINNYVITFLKDCPTVLNSFKFITDKMETILLKCDVCSDKPKRKRKKRPTKESYFAEENFDIRNSEDELIIDPNNKFSLLNIT